MTKFVIALAIFIFSCSHAHGQSQLYPFKIGIGAGIDRQFLNSFNYADFGENESIQGNDNFGFTSSIYLQKNIKKNTSIYISPRFIYNNFDVILYQAIPEYAGVEYSWQSKQYSLSAALGISQVLLSRANKKIYFKLGAINSFNSLDTKFNNIKLSFFSNKYDNIYTSINPKSTSRMMWIPGLEIGSGLRLYDAVDISISYINNLSQSKIVSYTSELGSQFGASDVKHTSGKLNIRSSYITAEVIFWLNRQIQNN